MRSIQQRLFIGLTVILSLLLVIQWLWLTVSIDRFIQKQIVGHLQEQTESLLASIKMTTDGKLFVNVDNISDVYDRPFSGEYYRVTSSGQGEWLSRSLWDFSLSEAHLNTGERQILFISGPEQQALISLSMAYHKLGENFTITVAQDISASLAEKKQFQILFTAFALLGLIVLVWIQTQLIKKALKPLQRAQRQLEQLDRGDIEQVDELAPTEIRPLLQELNRLINGLHQKTHRSRQALGNLAHRLKTELTLLNQQVNTDDEPKVLQQNVYQQSETIRLLIDRELKRARLLGLATPGHNVLMKVLTQDLVDTLVLIYPDKTIHFKQDIDDFLSVQVDREDMTELLGNLLDNAAKWCEHQVNVTVSAEQGIKLLIEDDGPGCDSDLLFDLTRRGFRADESTIGSGLGLAIVYDIVESYGGQLQFDTSTLLGGLQVTVHLQVSSSV